MVKTQRLHLRNLRPEDAPVIHAYRSDPDCARYQRWEDTSPAAVTAFVKQFANSAFLSKEEEQHYGICAGAMLVGDLSYFYTEADKCVTLGITIAPAHQRKGYARELLTAMVEAVREKFPALDIVALIDPENEASIALFENLGFEQECYAERIGSWVYVIYGREDPPL